MWSKFEIKIKADYPFTPEFEYAIRFQNRIQMTLKSPTFILFATPPSKVILFKVLWFWCKNPTRNNIQYQNQLKIITQSKWMKLASKLSQTELATSKYEIIRLNPGIPGKKKVFISHLLLGFANTTNANATTENTIPCSQMQAPTDPAD